MPLASGCSESAFYKNLKIGMREGKPRPQALAIAFSVLKKACGVKGKGKQKMKVKSIVAAGHTEDEAPSAISMEELLSFDQSELMALLREFRGDLKKQCVVLMGLPASGKSTFIRKGIASKYIPGFKGYSVVNSDAQVLRLQHELAREHFEKMLGMKGRDEFNKFVDNLKYVDNQGKMRVLSLTWEEFVDSREKGFNAYWKKFFRLYYATYFDIRDLAKRFDKDLFKTKVSRSGRLGLSPLEAKEALGLNPDQGLHSYEGSREEAVQDLLDFSLKRTRDEIAQLLDGQQDPAHNEAKVIVWSNLKINDGHQVNVTAREGATPEMVAGTVLVYKTALEILRQNGVG